MARERVGTILAVEFEKRSTWLVRRPEAIKTSKGRGGGAKRKMQVVRKQTRAARN